MKVTWNLIHHQRTRHLTSLQKILLIIIKNNGSARQCEFIRGSKCNRLKLTEEDSETLAIWNSGRVDMNENDSNSSDDDDDDDDDDGGESDDDVIE